MQNRTLFGIIVAIGVAVLPGAPTRAHTQMSGMSDMAASPFGIPMDRMGSGTTWIPDAVPVPSTRFMLGKWDFMLHGYAFAQYNKQGGARGDEQLGSLNWGMLMASHTLAGGRVQARTMLSLDAAGVTDRGYPLLLQSGETYRGKHIVDRQHPHDFFMELGVLYERALTGPVGFSLYAAASGEPALGPVAFMHRPSAIELPIAPLSHHWQDATHISFGVLTAGLFTRQWKLEGSVFNGREPDEERWNFDEMNFDSYSGRLTYNPTVQWSFSAGHGFLKSPEAMHPDESMHRTTAAALHSIKFGDNAEVASSLVWGANSGHGGPGITHSILAESRFSWNSRNTVFGRAERVQKSGSELQVESDHDGTSDRLFDVSSISAGYLRDFIVFGGVTVGIGGMGTLNVLPAALENAYGSRTPKGGLVFLRLRPTGNMGGMHDMEGMKHE